MNPEEKNSCFFFLEKFARYSLLTQEPNKKKKYHNFTVVTKFGAPVPVTCNCNGNFGFGSLIVKFKTFRANFFNENVFCAACLAGQTITRNINFKINITNYFIGKLSRAVNMG